MSTAGAVLDLVEIGPSARVDHITATDLDACRHMLTVARILNTAKSAARGPGWMVLDLHCNVDGVIGTAVAELNVVPAGDSAYRITQRSTIRLEPLDYLAGLMPGESNATYDGNTNYIGPTPMDDYRLIEHQYRYAAAIAEELCRCLDHALPECAVSSEHSIRLRRAELCRDKPVSDPLNATLLLCHSVVQGTRWLERSVYRIGSTSERGYPVARWWRKRKGAAYKVYAKAPAIRDQIGGLREEVSCQGRKALQHLGCGQRSSWEGDDVIALLAEFANAALPLLNELDSHVMEVLNSDVQPSDLFTMLSPLVLGMSGAPTGGRPTSPGQIAQLRHAFDSIVLTGQYRAKGLRKGVTMRSLLDRLCDPDGPLEKDPSLCLYSLKPQFTRASRALAAGTWVRKV